MAVYRVERTRDYTVMSNHHLKDPGLSLKAKGLLAIMLSLPDDWNYSTRGLAAICKEGVEAMGTGLKELEKAGYIVRHLLRGENGRITDTEYIIYERPQVVVLPEPEAPTPDMAEPGPPSPHPGNPYAAGPDAAAPCAGKPVQLNTDPVSTDRSNTHLSRPTEGNARGGAPGEAAGCSEQAVRFERERIRAQIEYDRIINVENREQVDEFVEIMLEVALSKSPTMKIGRDAEYPTAYVQHRFEQLTSAHIEKVLDGIRENTTRVWNTRAYLLAALFDAPASKDNYYTMAAASSG